MECIRILFTGVGRRIELIQAFREAALVLKKRIKIYGADMAGTAPALCYCDYTRKVCAMGDDGYIEELVDICKRDGIDLLVPTIDTDLLNLSINAERFEEVGTKVLISSSKMIGICRDKNITSEFFVGCGLKAPLPVNNWEEYIDNYPAFIKPKDGSSSIDAYKADNPKELEMYARQVKDYVVQRFIDGKEYTVDIFCDFQGNPIYIVPRERMAVRAGEVLKTKICMDEEIISEMKKLIAAFKPCGPMTVQLIKDNITGYNYYIEINPRFGGGAPLSMKAGAKSAEAILKILSGEKVSFADDIEDGAIYSRFDQSVRINSGKKELKGIIFDLDDTLYSEKDYVRSGYKKIADYLGDESYNDELWRYFEKGEPAIDKLLERIDRIDEKDKALNIYREQAPDIKLYPEVEKLLETLRIRGKKIGIITDGRPSGQRKKIEALGIKNLVDDIIITDELGGEQFRKPCDIAFRIIQTRWRLSPEEMAYVGDNIDKDFQAPQQLGMKTIRFNNKNGIYTSASDSNLNCINSLEDVLSMIR